MIRYLFILIAVIGLTAQLQAQETVPAPASAVKPPVNEAPALPAKLEKTSDKIANTNIPAKKEPRWVVQSIDIKHSKISLADPNSKQGIKFNLDKNPVVTNNGKAALLADIKSGDRVRVISKSGVIQKIFIESAVTKN